MATAIPWPKIKAEWLKGDITQRDLAQKYGVKLKTIQNRASNEGWKKEKGKIREKTEELLRDRVTRARVNRLEKLIAANEALLDGLVELAEQVKENPKLLIDKTGSIRKDKRQESDQFDRCSGYRKGSQHDKGRTRHDFF